MWFNHSTLEGMFIAALGKKHSSKLHKHCRKDVIALKVFGLPYTAVATAWKLPLAVISARQQYTLLSSLAKYVYA